MVDQPPQQGGPGCPKTLVDLDDDALANCFGFLGIRDVANLAMSCKPLCRVAYSDVVWNRLFRGHWPCHSVSSEAFGVREQYLARHTALHQLKFVDPLQMYFYTLDSVPASHILLDREIILVAMGSSIKSLRRNPIPPDGIIKTLRGHSARITCMRLFPVAEVSLFRNVMQHEDNVIVTSSSDRTIRLWWKDRSQRCFKGHNGPVTTLADTLLGDSGSKVLASGGEDCTVRLWSVNASGKQHPLILTYHGHEKPLSFLSVAGHKSSLLVSISKDSKVVEGDAYSYSVWQTVPFSSSSGSMLPSVMKQTNPRIIKEMHLDSFQLDVVLEKHFWVLVKSFSEVRVWDTSASSSSGLSSCVGMTSVCGRPVAMKCHDTLCYIASGDLITAIDLRTMQKAFTAAVHGPKMYSFEMLPSKWLICSGGQDKALLWDIRKNQENPEPVAELDLNHNKVTFLHMDPYKVVTAGPLDCKANVWDTGTGFLVNSLDCKTLGDDGPSAMAVDGCRIVTTGGHQQPGMVYYRDYSDCSKPVSLADIESGSKFWEFPIQVNGSPTRGAPQL